MSQKVFSLIFVSLFLLVGSSSATLYWASAANGDWTDDIWGGGVPGASDTAYINVGSTVTIDGTAQELAEFHHASWSGNSDLVTLNIINGGSLTVAGWNYLGVSDGDVGKIVVGSGSTYTGYGPMNVGYNGHCDLVVDGGTVNANGGLYVSNPWQTAGTGSGKISLQSGTINVVDFAMSANGLIDIEAGTLSIYGLWWDTTLEDLIDADQIIGYGGTEDVIISHQGDYTLLTAVPEPATILMMSIGGLLLRRKK